MEELVRLTERVSYLPASQEPLSADMVLVRGDSAWWIYDVGANNEAYALLQDLPVFFGASPLKKNIVISHFHPDHLGNLLRQPSKMKFDSLYVGGFTFKRLHFGTVVTEPLEFADGSSLKILSVPSSHSKGSLVMIADGIAFMGDAIYPCVGNGEQDFYNVQLLQELIKFVQNLPVDKIFMSHKKRPVYEKSFILGFLKNILERRTPSSPKIRVMDSLG